MLWTIFVILLVLWLLGLVTSYTLGGFIHILLVLAIIAVLVRAAAEKYLFRFVFALCILPRCLGPILAAASGTWIDR